MNEAAYLPYVLLDNMTKHNNSYLAKILQTVIHKLSFNTTKTLRLVNI